MRVSLENFIKPDKNNNLSEYRETGIICQQHYMRIVLYRKNLKIS